MITAVIAGYSRSPFTIANKGELVSVRPEDMLSEVIKKKDLDEKLGPSGIYLVLFREKLIYIGSWLGDYNKKKRELSNISSFFLSFNSLLNLSGDIY